MRGWQGLTVVLLGLLEFWRWIKWTLGWGEHVEFVSHNYPKWLAAMTNFFLNPPPSVSFALFLIGVVLFLVWNRERWLSWLPKLREVTTPEAGSRQFGQRTKVVGGTEAPRQGPNTVASEPHADLGSGPNWPAKAWFEHISPDAFELAYKEQVRRLAQDALSLERVKSWGRELRGNRELAMAPIPASFWAEARFQYDMEAGTFGAQSPSYGTRYTDIQVNRKEAAQAVSPLPPLPPSTTGRNSTERRELLDQAIKFIARTVRERPRDSDYFKAQLETDIAFLKLEPHLSDEFLTKLRKQRVAYVQRDGTNLPALASWYRDEIRRLEKEWELG